jgi:hypothetical protein
MGKYKLIEGEFTVAEAKELIISLFEYKIQFHSKENFSSEIKNGHSNERSLARKNELLKTKEDFMKHISSMDNDKVVAITAEIMVM